MERVTYRIPLNIAHVGYQRCIQGIYTGEALSRRIIITLTQNGSVYELPTDTSVTAYMYVLKPNASEPSINACVVDGETNTITYDISQADIETAGIVAMQLKVVESTSLGAVEKVLVAPKFTMEVEESDVSDSSATSTTTYTALTTALAKANAVYDSRLVSITTNDDHNIVFTYADGSSYESSAVTDALADVEDVFAEWMDASEAWAVGTMDDVPVTSDYEQYHNNSKYYSELASESASDAALSAVSASQSATNAATSATSASTYASQAYDYKEDAKDFYDDVVESVYDSEAWAKGTRNGVAVAETDETYHNNAAYYASQASGSGVAVKYEEQDKSEAERLIARTNIGAITENDVRIDKVKDASLTSVQNGQILTYNSTSGKWENTDIKLSKATDAYLTNMQDGQAIVYDASSQKWKNKDITPKYPLADVTDVEVVSGNSAITITWTNPSDVYIGPTKVAQLDQIYIYRNGVLLGTVPGERYVDDTMTSGIVYTYTLKAHATNGLLSAGVSVEGACGFTIKDWASKAGLTYTSLADITETDMRTLMTKHASCDYLAEAVESDSSVMTDFIANTYAMKWIGLRDYICDKLMAISAVKSAMLSSSSWEYILKDHVPIMTSDSAPYGEVIHSTMESGSNAYVAFSGTNSAQTLMSSANPAYLGYKFANPICVRKFKTEHVGSTNPPTNMVLQGSNDNSTWTTLKSGISFPTSRQVLTFEVDNDNYYLYYRLATTTSRSLSMWALQFYGRSLNISVPTMTSNTAPYGEVISSTEKSASYPAWYAFDKNSDTRFASYNVVDSYCGYDFKKPICVKAVSYILGADIVTNETFKIQGCNGSTWVDLAEFTQNKGHGVILLNNNDSYTKYRLIQKSVVQSWEAYAYNEINFFGLDYSERTDRTYLYDHGLEIVPISSRKTSYGTEVATKNSDNLYIAQNSVLACSAFYTDEVDFTSKSIMRATIKDIAYSGQQSTYNSLTVLAVGNQDYVDGIPRVGATAARVNLAPDAPNNLYLDVSSVSGNYKAVLPVYSGASSSVNLYINYNEWWLE